MRIKENDLYKKIHCNDLEKKEIILKIKEIVTLFFRFLENGYESIRNDLTEPLFKIALDLEESGASLNTIEKTINYYFISNESRGIKLFEKLISKETVLSLVKNEHPIVLMHKLYSFLGEKNLEEIKIFDEIQFYSSQNSKNIEFLNECNKIDRNKIKKISNDDFFKIIDFDYRQLEYIFLDYDPYFLAHSMKDLDINYQKLIFSIFNREYAEMLKYSLDWVILDKTKSKENRAIILNRIKGILPNSMELRKKAMIKSNLILDDFFYKLRFKEKELNTIFSLFIFFMGLATNIRQNGFKSSKANFSELNSIEDPIVKYGLFILLNGYKPELIHLLLENLIVSGDYNQLEYFKKLISLESIVLISMGYDEIFLFEFYIQTIGEKYRTELENYLQIALDSIN
jgi:hypothetical protein